MQRDGEAAQKRGEGGYTFGTTYITVLDPATISKFQNVNVEIVNLKV